MLAPSPAAAASRSRRRRPYDLRRSRLTVFFRLLLSLPHIVWSSSGRSWPSSRRSRSGSSRSSAAHRLRTATASSRAYVRYRLHVYAYLYLVANPFPGFTGTTGTLSARPRGRRARATEPLEDGLPARALDSGSARRRALGGALFAAALLTWFYALAKGAAPWGLRNLSAYALRYDAQTEAYLLLLTDRYPHASPLEGEAGARHAGAK